MYWLIKQMQGEEDFKMLRVIKDDKESIKIVNSNKRIKATFADLDILHELKAKLKKDEKKLKI